MNPPNEHEARSRPAAGEDKGAALGQPVNNDPLSVSQTVAVAVRPEMHLARRSTWALTVASDSHANAADPNQKADQEAIESWENEGDPN
jgi:hypothetical protein